MDPCKEPPWPKPRRLRIGRISGILTRLSRIRQLPRLPKIWWMPSEVCIKIQEEALVTVLLNTWVEVVTAVHYPKKVTDQSGPAP